MMDHLLFSLVPLTVFVILWRQKVKNLAPVPPGPPRLPVVGNLFNAPQDFAWKTYLDWGRLYDSDILYMNILGTQVIILNTQETASDLLDKRSRIYSSRPSSYSASHLIQCDWIVSSMPYNNAWRESRRLLAKYLARPSTGSRSPVMGFTDFEWQRPHVIKYTRYFLRNLLQQPDAFMDHTFKLTGSISVSCSHGLDISAEQDEHIMLAKKAGDALKFAFVPGRFLVDSLPLLRFAPEWVKFKRLARIWREDVKQFLVVPFTRAKIDLVQQNYQVEMPSILSQELSKPGAVDDEILQGALATVFIGGSSTTSAALNVFFLAMTCYARVQTRAQQELDSLLASRSRQLPTHADLVDLPYCMAVVYEALRWHVAGPIGLPHLSTEEDVYMGYRIPGGSVIIPNIWAMMRDPSKFQNPDEFLPERFLNPDGKLDEASVKKVDPVFGFGRRICVGRSLALSILAHAVCCVLTVFDIQKKLDDDGKPLEPRVEFDPSITSSPLPFACTIKPRSSQAEKVILGLFEL